MISRRWLTRTIPLVTRPIADPAAMVRSRGYAKLLAVAALLGVPISAAACAFLALDSYLQKELFTALPRGLGFATAPAGPRWRCGYPRRHGR
jgi:hypothetical protein